MDIRDTLSILRRLHRAQLLAMVCAVVAVAAVLGGIGAVTVFPALRPLGVAAQDTPRNSLVAASGSPCGAPAPGQVATLSGGLIP